MNFERQLKPISRHAREKLTHGAWFLSDRPRTQRKLNSWFVNVSKTRQQLANPAPQAEYEEYQADDQQDWTRHEPDA